MSAWMPWEQNFVDRMVRLREARKLRQVDLAKLLAERGLKFHQQTVARIEARERAVRLDEAYVIAEVLEADLPTMTKQMVPSEVDIQFAVDRLRRVMREGFDELSETFWHLLEGIEMLGVELADRVEEAGGAQAQGFDAVTDWGLRNLFLAYDYAVRLRSVRDVAGKYGRHDDAAMGLEAEVLVAIEEWMDALYIKLQSRELHEPEQLDAWLAEVMGGEDDDGVDQEAP